MRYAICEYTVGRANASSDMRIRNGPREFDTRYANGLRERATRDCDTVTVDFTPVRISVSGVERSWRGACVYGDMNMYISSTCARVWSRVRLGLERFLCLLRLMRFELNG